MANNKTTTTTRKTQKKAEELRISSVGDVKNRIQGIFEMPSGFVFKLRNPGGMAAFMGSGVMPNSLLKIVQENISKGEGRSQEDQMKDILEDEDAFGNMVKMLEIIALRCIIEPKVYPVPEDMADRDDDLLYVDEVPLEDKQFIMAWLQGGVKSLEDFRARQQANVASVPAGEGNEDTAVADDGADNG